MVVDICKIFELNSHYWRLSWGKNLQKTKFKVILRQKLTDLLLESQAVWREKTRRIMMMMIMMIIKTLAFMKMMLRFFFLPLYNNPFEFLEGFGARLIIKWAEFLYTHFKRKGKKKMFSLSFNVNFSQSFEFYVEAFLDFWVSKILLWSPNIWFISGFEGTEGKYSLFKSFNFQNFFFNLNGGSQDLFFSRGFSFFSLSIMAQSKNFLFFHIFWCCLVVFPYFLSSKQKTKKPKLTEGGP